MKTSLFRFLIALAFLAAGFVPAQAEPFPLKLHKKLRNEVRDTLGIDRGGDRRDRSRDYDRRDYYGDRRYRGGSYHYHNPRPLYYQDPYYYDDYGSSLTIQRTVVEQPVYRQAEEEALTLEQRVQIELAKEGFYRGEIDGIVGPGTRAAIRQYQYEEDLPVTGRIDRDLLRDLDII